MNIWNDYFTADGLRCTFRRKHPAESYAGIPGVFALTVIEDFAIKALHFEAANDLAAADDSELIENDVFVQLSSRGKIGVAVCLMRNTDAEYRQTIARALNDANTGKPKEEAA